jgi:GTP cyclohydrolase I
MGMATTKGEIMHDKAKQNEQLGREVNEYLVKMGVQTPMTDQVEVDNAVKLLLIEEQTRDMLLTLGLDLTDDSLIDTPKRVAKMYVNEIFSGLRADTFPKCTAVDNKMTQGDEFVLEKNITLFSDCEHHLRPIIGKCHISYIPGKKVLGLSKMNRLVHYFARRPQIQERLNQQIAHAMAYITGSDDVIVIIDAGHTCVSQRGVMDTNSTTATLTALGKFGEPDSPLRREVLAAANS